MKPRDEDRPYKSRPLKLLQKTNLLRPYFPQHYTLAIKSLSWRQRRIADQTRIDRGSGFYVPSSLRQSSRKNVAYQAHVYQTIQTRRPCRERAAIPLVAQPQVCIPGILRAQPSNQRGQHAENVILLLTHKTSPSQKTATVVPKATIPLRTRHVAGSRD